MRRSCECLEWPRGSGPMLQPCLVALPWMLRDPTCALTLQPCTVLQGCSLGREWCGHHCATGLLPCSCLQTCISLGEVGVRRRLHPFGHHHFPVSPAGLVAQLPSDLCPTGSPSAPACLILRWRGGPGRAVGHARPRSDVGRAREAANSFARCLSPGRKKRGCSKLSDSLTSANTRRFLKRSLTL